MEALPADVRDNGLPRESSWESADSLGSPGRRRGGFFRSEVSSVRGDVAGGFENSAKGGGVGGIGSTVIGLRAVLPLNTNAM